MGPSCLAAQLGWVYVPEDQLDSIADLESESVMRKLDGRIVGIGPEAGLMTLSRDAMKAHGLKKFGYTLQNSSGPGMTAALERAIVNRKWIVVNGWTPHWMWARWNLRFLRDTKGVFKLRQPMDVLVRHGFYQDDRKVFAFLSRMMLSLQAVQEGMNVGAKTNCVHAAKQYVEAHPARVHYWITGELPDGAK